MLMPLLFCHSLGKLHPTEAHYKIGSCRVNKPEKNSNKKKKQTENFAFLQKPTRPKYIVQESFFICSLNHKYLTKVLQIELGLFFANILKLFVAHYSHTCLPKQYVYRSFSHSNIKFTFFPFVCCCLRLAHFIDICAFINVFLRMRPATQNFELHRIYFMLTHFITR